TVTPNAMREVEDLFEDALGSLFNITQPAEGNAGQVLTYEHSAVGTVIFRVVDVEAKNSKLAAQWQWSSGRALSDLLCEASQCQNQDLASAQLLNPAGKAIIELGSGSGLPTIVATRLGALLGLATDYPDVKLIACLRANVEPAGAHAIPLLWGENQATKLALNRLPEHLDGYDLVMCSDVLWMSNAHDGLLESIHALLGHSMNARAILVNGFHTGRRVLGDFFKRAVDFDLIPDWELPFGGIWERTAGKEPLAWQGASIPYWSSAENQILHSNSHEDADIIDEMEIEERGSWLVYCILR
ncbi:hypothetical protein K437DRAFT_215266, partial [Tilletiaria anomala UBC 951]